MAHEGLASHIKFWKKNNMLIPKPRTMEQIENTWEEWEAWKTDNDYIVAPINKLSIVTKAKE